MPTLRQKVEQFCVGAGTTNASSMRIAKLEEALKKAKETFRERIKNEKYQHAQTRKATKKAKPTPKAKTLKAPKAPKAPKKPKVKQEVTMKPLPAQAEPMMPAPPAPVPAPTLAPAAPQAGGRRRR